MKLKNIFDKKLRDHGKGEGVLQSTKVSILGYFLHYHHDDRLISFFWKSYDETHGNVNPKWEMVVVPLESSPFHLCFYGKCHILLQK